MGWMGQAIPLRMAESVDFEFYKWLLLVSLRLWLGRLPGLWRLKLGDWTWVQVPALISLLSELEHL